MNNKKQFKRTLAIAGLKIALVILTTITLGIPKLIKLISNKINEIEKSE